MNRPTVPLLRVPQVIAALAVGLALLYVNGAALTWYPSSSFRWRPGDLELDGWDDCDGHLGWPTTYFTVTNGGLEHRPSSWWIEIPCAPSRMSAFLGPFQLVANIIWSSAIVFAVWRVAAHVTHMARRAQYTLRTAFVVMTAVALVVFLEWQYRQAGQLWHDYDAHKPYLTWSALYHWFGARSSFDWLCRFPALVRAPITLGWLSLVVVVCSTLRAFGRRLGCGWARPAAPFSN